MKKVIKFVKGKKDDRKVFGDKVVTSRSCEFPSPLKTTENDEREDFSGYSVDFSGKDKTFTKLHKAAWQGNLEKLKVALKKIEIDSVDRQKRTPLHLAVVRGHPSIVWFLLGNNAKTSIRDQDGQTALHKAVESDHKECTMLLIESGADVNCANYSGNTPLHISAKHQSISTVSALLEKGARMEMANNDGDYPLHIATTLENTDLVGIMLIQGASVNILDKENRTPLMIAAKLGNQELVNLFIKYKAHLNVVDSNGWLAEDYALLSGQKTVAAHLKAIAKERKETSNYVDEKKDYLVECLEGIKKNFNILGELNSSSKAITETDEKTEIHTQLRKEGDIFESPEEEVMPPYCQPPRSWEMIQAGMIDGSKNFKDKKRAITILGTVVSRRESFSDGSNSLSPKHTLSLNRRKKNKLAEPFSKQRFSLNEDEVLKKWFHDGISIMQEKNDFENKKNCTLRNVGSEKNISRESLIFNHVNFLEKEKLINKEFEPENRASDETNREEKIHKSPDSKTSLGVDLEKSEHLCWTNFENEKDFPSPPTALELGVDLAKSMKLFKQVSVDRPLINRGNVCSKNHFSKNSDRESYPLNGFLETSKETIFRGHSRRQSTSSLKWNNQEITNWQKQTPNFLNDVNKKVNKQLECYDQALRELSQSSSIQSVQETKSHKKVPENSCNEQISIETDSRSFLNSSTKRKTQKTDGEFERVTEGISEEQSVRQSKRRMLLAMREIKHEEMCTEKEHSVTSPTDFSLEKIRVSKSSSESSIEIENPFFYLERQQTVIEEDELVQQPNEPSEEYDNEELKEEAEKEIKDIETTSFSPLGIIYREIERENFGKEMKEVDYNAEEKEKGKHEYEDSDFFSSLIEIKTR